MLPTDNDPLADDEFDFHEEVEDESAAELETEAVVTCPHCGETMTMLLDPAGGQTQEYVEDCQVCCRPWKVQLWYGTNGSADVQLFPIE